MAALNQQTSRTDIPAFEAPSIALYSHDAMGVGHVRRNLLIAQALSRPPFGATSLLICGVHEASAFTGGFGIDCLTLPSFEKHANDDYRPRELWMSAKSVTQIRAATLKSALSAMAPDVFIVDKVPMGLNGELEDVLPQLRSQGTRIVFGMRDVLDAPELVAEEWLRHGYDDFICDNYDQVWVYGEEAVFDTGSEYGFSEALRGLMRYTGYLDQRERLNFSAPLDASANEEFGDLSNTTLCMLGGGEDGFTLASAFVNASLPTGTQGLLVTGPLMAAEAMHALQAVAAGRPEMRILRQVRDADLLVSEVRQVICMGGYNSMLSVVSFEKPALIVPRVSPRKEQLIRANLFERLGLLDVMHPDNLTSDTLSDWILRGTTSVNTNHSEPHRLDLNGLQRICAYASGLCKPPPTILPAPPKRTRSLGTV